MQRAPRRGSGRSRERSWCVALLPLALGGCVADPEPSASTAPASSSGALVGALASGATRGAAIPSSEPAPSRLTASRAPLRLVDARFVRAEGAAADRRTVFALTLPTPTPARVEAWIFYYDREGRLLRRVPERLDVSREAKGETELALGLRGALAIPKAAERFEAEITRAVWGSGERWHNLNLLAPWARERPLGGPSREELEAHAGERLVLSARGLPSEPGRRVTFDVESRSDAQVTGAAVFVHFVDAEGRRVGGAADYVERALAPGARLSLELGPRRGALPAGVVAVEAGAYEVLFADGARFSNDDLAATDAW